MTSVPRNDRGSVAIETALLAPVIVLFVLIVVAAGRVQSTRAEVEEAARAGARAASLARTQDGARQAATDAIAGVLDERGVHCTHRSLAPLTYGKLDTPGGQLDTVTVGVSCTVVLGDLMELRGLTWDARLTGTFTSVIDRYRGN